MKIIKEAEGSNWIWESVTADLSAEAMKSLLEETDRYVDFLQIKLKAVCEKEGHRWGKEEKQYIRGDSLWGPNPGGVGHYVVTQKCDLCGQEREAPVVDKQFSPFSGKEV